MKRGGQFRPLMDKLMEKIEVDPSSGCWIWKGALNNNGYGILYIKLPDGRRAPRLAHRLMYAERIGPLTDGLVLDHLCRVRNCANPEHLEQTTHRINILRGEGLAAKRAVATHCVHGHELSGDNVILVNGRYRRCRECKLIESRLYQKENREAISAKNKLWASKNLDRMRELRRASYYRCKARKKETELIPKPA